eukprot:jgi/Galph1/5717/GphlegSOOS_G4404.1
MKYLAAYLLATLSSKSASPTVDDVKKILTSVGIEVEEERVKQVVEALHGKSIEELISQGQQKMTSVPSGAAAATIAAAATETGAPTAETKKSEKAAEKEEAAEESDEDLGFGLFD